VTRDTAAKRLQRGAELSLSPLFTWRGVLSSEVGPTDGKVRGVSVRGPTLRHVALTLSLHMNERGGSCFPSVDTLAIETGLDERTVRRAIALLEDKGWLSVTRSRGGNKNNANRYRAAYPVAVTELLRADDAAITTGGTVPPHDAARGGGTGNEGGQDAPRGRQEDDKSAENFEITDALIRWMNGAGALYAEVPDGFL
jgi:hypothetical protein